MNKVKRTRNNIDEEAIVYEHALYQEKQWSRDGLPVLLFLTTEGNFGGVREISGRTKLRRGRIPVGMRLNFQTKLHDCFDLERFIFLLFQNRF